jgi:hypothetical protein
MPAGTQSRAGPSRPTRQPGHTNSADRLSEPGTQPGSDAEVTVSEPSARHWVTRDPSRPLKSQPKSGRLLPGTCRPTLRTPQRRPASSQPSARQDSSRPPVVPVPASLLKWPQVPTISPSTCQPWCPGSPESPSRSDSRCQTRCSVTCWWRLGDAAISAGWSAGACNGQTTDPAKSGIRAGNRSRGPRECPCRSGHRCG